MYKKVKTWYQGEVKIHEDIIGVYTDRHWSANIVRYIVNFCIKHWTWLFGGTTISILIALYL